ncbi:hypothetical protein HYV64_04630 [Candidatus Shapirobacteria bacterium]|nr:hypothetical protein [Candidatus Shapirobacteria bacterium]
MKIVVTHNSPDWDAITSVWLIKRFLPGWDQAEVRFVPAGSKLERIGNDKVLHVDTGLGPLDHHQTNDKNVCGASLTFNFVKQANSSQFIVHSSHPEREKHREEALSRIVRVVVDIDHFGEVFWDNPTADYHEFSLLGVLEGLKLAKPDEDMYYIDVGMTLLDALLHSFENRIWAEKEIAERGIKFKTKWGKGIGFETINDTVLALAQKMRYVVVVRKDPRKGYIRIKARPLEDIDLTLVYEKLKKMDPLATWFLHVSKKMLLNGTVKNPTMRPTRLSLDEIIKVLEQI